MEYILIFISAIFVNNIVLSQFLGICPFLGVSKKVETAMGMSAAVSGISHLRSPLPPLACEAKSYPSKPNDDAG